MFWCQARTKIQADGFAFPEAGKRQQRARNRTRQPQERKIPKRMLVAELQDRRSKDADQQGSAARRAHLGDCFGRVRGRLDESDVEELYGHPRSRGSSWSKTSTRPRSRRRAVAADAGKGAAGIARRLRST